ncbi:MAG: group III truncated hemoglobin [Crocinitomicaceae bacterium]|nr:MAG: group III truncated hemoglobin [Crocinitomicaceae bacterium]
MEDLHQLEDVKKVVDAFYDRIRTDELLGKIFNEVIQDQWPTHLEKMYRFWQTVLFDEHTYSGSPFAVHAKLPVAFEHFERWIQLFNETIDAHFSGEKADQMKNQGKRMAAIFHSKIEFFKNLTSISES